MFESVNLKSIKISIAQNYFEIISFTAISILIIASAIGLPVGIDSINLIRVFNNDEARGAELLQHCLAHNNLDPNFYYYYGMLYYTICFGINKLIFLFSNLSELPVFTIALVLKLVSLLSFIFFAMVFYRMCRLFLSKEWSCLCLLAISTIDSFSVLGRMIHPDMLEIALVVLSFNIVFKNHSLKTVWVAQFVAGLAFGTKYNALFAFPFLFLPYLFEKYFTVEKFSFNKIQLLHLVSITVKGGLLFLLGWIIFNPYAVINYKYFLDTLLQHSANASAGFVELKVSKNPFEWLQVFWKEIPRFTILLLVLSVILAFVLPLKNKFGISSRNFNHITLFSYAVFCFLYIFFLVRLRDMRYSFHFLPMLFVCCFYFLQAGFKKFKMNFLIPLFLIASVVTTLQYVKSFPTAIEKLANPLLKSGKILGDNFSKEIKIYCDFYSYVPDSFLQVNYDWAVNEILLVKINPDVVIMNHRRSGKKAWIKPGTALTQKQWTINPEAYPDAIKKQIDFYNFLLQENSNYKLFYEDDNLIIFSKKG